MSLVVRYTTSSGPGATAAGTPSTSLGGFASETDYSGGVMYDLFNRSSTLDVQGSRNDYRCLFLFSDGSDLTGVRLYVDPVTAGGTLAVGLDTRPTSEVDATAPQATEISSSYTAPSGVTFSAPSGYSTGIVLGDLPDRYGKAVWVRRTPSETADAAAEACDLIAQSASGVLWTKRVYWPVERAAEPAAPAAPGRPGQYVQTPTPFTRVMVDFVGADGARVTWHIDDTMHDAGPYVYQLQMSRSGIATATDWVNVGPPAREAPYLDDPTTRLWGMSAVLHYRVVLTTAVTTYTSPPADVFGVLGQRDWLHVREIVRKERMYQRELVGRPGFLLKAKRYGTYCTCTDPVTHEVGNSSCPLCYGLGIEGGYHPPVPLLYAIATGEKSIERVEYNESTGVNRKSTVVGRVLADVPLVVQRDAWVSASGSDERYHVWSVEEAASWMDVPVVYRVELRLAPRSDVLYTVPVTRPDDYVPTWRDTVTVTI